MFEKFHIELARNFIEMMERREFMWPNLLRKEMIFFVWDSGELWDVTAKSSQQFATLHLKRFYSIVSGGIVAHNHPNGTNWPSKEDLVMAEYINSNCKGRLMSHMIVVPLLRKSVLYDALGQTYRLYQ